MTYPRRRYLHVNGVQQLGREERKDLYKHIADIIVEFRLLNQIGGDSQGSKLTKHCAEYARVPLLMAGEHQDL